METTNSTHRVEIVPVVLEKHPNADTLSIVHIDGYQVIVKTADWPVIGAGGPSCTDSSHGGGTPSSQLGAYIPPDSLVPVDRPEFAFLVGQAKHTDPCPYSFPAIPAVFPPPKCECGAKVRIKARKLRGEWSMGLLIPAPEGCCVGFDVADLLGVKHYEPPEPNATTGGEAEKAPSTIFREITQFGQKMTVLVEIPTYHVEAFRKYGSKVLTPGEPVWVTEKIHGTNGRWVHDGKRYYCGSHTQWKRYDENNLWWKALAGCPALSNFLHMNPGTAVYGEVYGQVQDLKYGCAKNEIRVAVFDILHQGKWVDAIDAYSFQPNRDGPPAWTMPWVPCFNTFNTPAIDISYEFDELIKLADGPSMIPGATNVREGIVIKPVRERWHAWCGRVCLKVVSNQYLERA